MVRDIIYECCDTLRNSLCRDNNNLFIFNKVYCLVCSHDDILVVWQDKYCLCIYMLDSVEHILCARVHGLTTLYEIVHSKASKHFIHACSD